MYVRRNCSDVDVARYALMDRGVVWTEVDIDKDADGLAKVMSWNNGRSPTPTFWIGDKMLVEPSDREVEAALKEAGLIKVG